MDRLCNSNKLPAEEKKAKMRGREMAGQEEEGREQLRPTTILTQPCGTRPWKKE